MDGENIGSALILAVLGLIGTAISTVVIGWIAIQAGLSRIIAIGAAFVPAVIAVLGFLGVGGQTNNMTVNTDISIDETDLPLQGKEKETSPKRADFPERRAKFIRKLRDQGLGYATMQNILKAGVVLGVFIMTPFAVAFITLPLEQIGADIPPEFVAFGEWVISAIGAYPTMLITTAGVAVAAFSTVGHTELNNILHETTCDECGKNFCLSYDYVLYNSGTQKEHEDEVYDDNGELKGTITSGYSYKGSLYATCTTRNERVEIEDWNWYVST